MALRKPKQKWKVGDLFVVKAKDAKFVLGQVVGREAAVLNSVSVAFFDRRYDSPEAAADTDPPDPNDVFSVVFATRDLLDLGHWRVVGHHSPLIPEAMLPYENLRKAGFVGAKVFGSAIINEFLDAFYGLSPWDDWKDPSYLDGLLVSATKKPPKLVYKHR